MIQNIKHLTYDYKNKKMIIVLKTPTLHNGYIKKYLAFNCSEEVFIEKCDKWLKTLS